MKVAELRQKLSSGWEIYESGGTDYYLLKGRKRISVDPRIVHYLESRRELKFPKFTRKTVQTKNGCMDSITVEF